ncbi:MAG: TVP38/TMEM64 family protein [Nitrospirae bacterium]|nr:TVP38/TMEM64 family protein [Nitrospirota bacterium]
MKQKIRLTCGLIFVFVAVLLIFNYHRISPEVVNLYHLFSDKERTRALLASFGVFAPLVFIGLQSLQVVFAPIPGEATGFLGGYMFGLLPGFIYSTVGLTLGSYLAFRFARFLEKSFVEAVVGENLLKKFDFLVQENGVVLSFLLFLIPGFPKDYLCFILGLSPMPTRLFLVMVLIGRIPGTVMLSLQGANVYSESYTSFFILLGVSVLLGMLVILYRDPIYDRLKRWANNRNGSDTEKT